MKLLQLRDGSEEFSKEREMGVLRKSIMKLVVVIVVLVLLLEDDPSQPTCERHGPPIRIQGRSAYGHASLHVESSGCSGGEHTTKSYRAEESSAVCIAAECSLRQTAVLRQPSDSLEGPSYRARAATPSSSLLPLPPCSSPLPP